MTDDRTAANLAIWMRNVMQFRRWSAERWAKEAGISATTITRFLKDPERMDLRFETVYRLGASAESHHDLMRAILECRPPTVR